VAERAAKVLAVDPGQKRIGVAVSDESGRLARPLRVILHVARPADAAEVVRIAVQEGVGLILVGQSVDDEGQLTFQGRGAVSLAAVIRELTAIPVEMWDEAFSTQDARAVRLRMGANRKGRSGHLDDVAAAVILQSYLDVRNPPLVGVAGTDEF
jgi:putative holliday junction resolvase